MRIFSIILLVLVLSCRVFSLNKKPDKFFVVEFKGLPKIEQQKDGVEITKVSRVEKDKIIRGQAVITTDDKSEVVLQIESGLKLKIYPETEIHFPQISWESGSIENFLLKKGRIRWHSEIKSKIKMISDLFESVLPEGVFLISYSQNTPQVQVLVFKGEIEFQEKNGEESLILKENKKAQFLGKIEDGEIAYDVLLHGRKIPKGQKSQIENLSSDEYRKYSLAEELKNIEAMKKKKEQAIMKTPQRNNEICQKPNGLFNECAWICENNPKDQNRCRVDLPKVHCVRKRCNANGLWSERYELDIATGGKICKTSPVVQACDY